MPFGRLLCDYSKVILERPHCKDPLWMVRTVRVGGRLQGGQKSRDERLVGGVEAETSTIGHKKCEGHLNDCN